MFKEIKKLIAKSKLVIKDCALENGAIVAANTDHDYYPREAANYRWVWPRDAAFICRAADILGLKEIPEKYFRWLLDRPQDFKKDSLLYTNYATNGRFGSMGKIFQPDQMGESLWAIYSHFKNDLSKALKFKELIERLANGLCRVWQKTHFSIHTIDLWEDVSRKTTTTMENNFTYSLAACAHGLILANKIIPHSLWLKTAQQMIKEIEEAYDQKRGYFLRSVGKVLDTNIDASLLGLVWPFEIFSPDDPRMIRTIERIERNLVENGGVHRFQFDYFDSEGSAWEGGGAWPILNFWLAIYWLLRKNRKKALSYYQWVVKKVRKFNYFIPEQIFEDFRIGLYPLAWSHAMFIIASQYLGFIK
ncbi:MAG: hypothetical protein N2259_03230 [Patescibacteria group bacterium]|nr:hypothetical protein [Patescibacteria group bacterium]